MCFQRSATLKLFVLLICLVTYGTSQDTDNTNNNKDNNNNNKDNNNNNNKDNNNNNNNNKDGSSADTNNGNDNLGEEEATTPSTGKEDNKADENTDNPNNDVTNNNNDNDDESSKNDDNNGKDSGTSGTQENGDNDNNNSDEGDDNNGKDSGTSGTQENGDNDNNNNDEGDDNNGKDSGTSGTQENGDNDNNNNDEGDDNNNKANDDTNNQDSGGNDNVNDNTNDVNGDMDNKNDDDNEKNDGSNNGDGDNNEGNNDNGSNNQDGVDNNNNGNDKDDNGHDDKNEKGENTTESPTEKTTDSGLECRKSTCVHGSCNDDSSSPDLCLCQPGWTGPVCDQDVDECQEKGICAQVCVNTEGSYTCECNSGFTFIDDKNCQDVDECAAGAAGCGEKEFCRNTEGGFQCVCRPGFGGERCKEEVSRVYGGSLAFQVREGSQQTWSSDLLQLHSQAFRTLAARLHKSISDVLQKKDVRFVEVSVVKFTRQSGNPDTIVAEYQVKMKEEQDVGRLQRAVDSGFSRCGEDDVCEFGVYSNHLLYGALRNRQAIEEDYDLCQDDRTNVCHDASTQCVSANGTATCHCRPGFQPWSLYDNACQDVDECDGGDLRKLCGVASGSKCVNTDGSYYCNCPKTHHWDSQKMSCLWWNICKRDNPCLNEGRCFNTQDRNDEADFVCRCPYWWTGRVCGTVDPQAEQMRNALVGVSVALFVVCVVLIITIILLCLQRHRRKKEEKKSAFRSYDFGNASPPTTKKDDSIPDSNPPPPEPVVEESTYGGDRLSRGSPVPSVTEGVPTWGESPTSPRKGKSAFGSYDFGFTPKRSAKKRDKSGAKNVNRGGIGKPVTRPFNAYEYTNNL